MQRTYALDFTVGEVPCKLMSIDPQWEPPQKDTPGQYYQHRHPSFEMHYVTSGSAVVSADKKKYTVIAGEVLLVPPGVYHYVSSVSPDHGRMTMSFAVNTSGQDSRDPNTQDFCAAFEAKEPLIEVVAQSALADDLAQIRLLAQNYENQYISQEKMRALCAVFLLDLFEVLAQKKLRALTVRTGTPEPRDYAIDSFFGSNFSSNNANIILSRQLNVSPRQLHRIIKKTYGMNYREKLKEIRLEIAVDFLTNSDKRMEEIGLLLGYSSSANFSAFIKKATGMTPTQIRNAARK